MVIQINPLDENSIRARIRRCAAYHKLSQFNEMKSDLDELRRLQKLGLATGEERRIEALSAHYHSLKDFEGCKKRSFLELYAEGLASIQSVSTCYRPRQSIGWNVNALLHRLKFELEYASKRLCKTGDLNKHLIPHICSCRRSADALIHLAFRAPVEQKVFPRIMPNKSSRVAVLRVSDTMKNSLVLTLEQRQSIMRGEELPFPILDQTEDFLPYEGFIIAFHLILECELCSPSLFRWIISDGTVIHTDRQRIGSELLSDIAFLPSLFGEDGKALVADPRWFQQVAVCRRLYDLLLGGLESYFSPVERLIIVPDIHLFRVSFDALLSSDGHYLIENHTVSISSSIRLIRENQEQKMRLLLREDLSLQIGVLVCGDARTTGAATGTKVDKIVRFLQDDCEVDDDIVVLSRCLFTPSLLQESCRVFHPRLLHVTAHGCATDLLDEEENSDILEQYRIHGEMESSDGTVISARDVAWNYDLSGTDLVFLKSCSVGYGKLQKSGVLGFNNAIFQAGCPSVISSLWPANATLSTELAKLFYRFYLIHHYDKAESLRQAIVHLLLRYQWVELDDSSVRLRSSPALWASFQLFGNPV